MNLLKCIYFLGKTFRIPKELEPDDTRKRKRKKQPEPAKLQSISEFCTITCKFVFFVKKSYLKCSKHESQIHSENT